MPPPLYRLELRTGPGQPLNFSLACLWNLYTVPHSGVEEELLLIALQHMLASGCGRVFLAPRSAWQGTDLAAGRPFPTLKCLFRRQPPP